MGFNVNLMTEEGSTSSIFLHYLDHHYYSIKNSKGRYAFRCEHLWILCVINISDSTRVHFNTPGPESRALLTSSCRKHFHRKHLLKAALPRQQYY